MAALVCVCTPSSLASRGSSLYWGGWRWTRGSQGVGLCSCEKPKWKDRAGREGFTTGSCPPPPRGLPMAPDTCHLMIQHEQKRALDVEVSGPFHLEAISLLGGGHSVPLAGREADLITKGVGISIHAWPSKAASLPPAPAACQPALPVPQGLSPPPGGCQARTVPCPAQ